MPTRRLGSTGSLWFTAHQADLLRNAEFLLNEGGENLMGRDGRTIYYGLDATEKVPYWLRLTVRGEPGHGSQPTQGNAALRLSRVLGRIADWETPLVLTPPAAAYLQALATREANPTHRAWLADPAAALQDPAAVAWLTADRYQNAILRNTVTITVLKGSTNTNVIPSEALGRTRRAAAARPARRRTFSAQLRAVIRDTTVEVTPISKLAGGPLLTGRRDPSSTRSPTAVAAMDPGALVLPEDADRLHRLATTIAPSVSTPTGSRRWRTTDEISATVHGNNERVPVPEVRFGVEFYYRIVEQLAR